MDRSKLLTIFGVAWLSAGLLTWLLYAKTKAPKVEKTVKILAATRDLASGTKLAKEDLKLVAVVDKDLPRSALTSPGDAIGRAVIYPVGAGELVTSSRLTSLSGADGIASVIEAGKRAVSVPFTDSTGASGLIQPRSHIDVLFTRTGNAIEAMTVTLLEDIEVLSVGRVVQVETQAPGTTTKAPSVTPSSTAQRTATLVVTPEQAQKLELAKNQGKISLSLRNPLDRSTRTDVAPATLEEIDPMLVARASGIGRRAGRIPANVKDRKAWAKLIGEEDEPKKPPPPPPPPPPKPKTVVDVFRGDKHVQEIFQ